MFNFKDNSKGTALAILSSLSFSISMSVVKLLDYSISVQLIVLIRNCIILLWLLPLAIRQNWRSFKTAKLLLHCVRIILILSSMLCTYSAYRHLPLSTASAIGMTGPLFTAVLSATFLREKIPLKKWGLILLGYFGVIILLRPSTFISEPIVIVALLANIFAACSVIIAKILLQQDSPLTLTLYSSIGITIALGIASFNDWQPIAAKDLIILLIIGLLGNITQLCFSFALKYAKASAIAPIEYIRIVFAVSIGIIVFNEQIDGLTILGSAIIIGSTLILTYIENKTSNT